MAASPTFEAMRAGYKKMWQKCELKQSRFAEIDTSAKRLLASRVRYEAVERKTGVPWFWIACAHMRESGADFRGVLHNGEHIVGTNKKTVLVPAGRGPFATWEDAAVDALVIKGFHKITDWCVERLLYCWELFNGFGYTARGVNSPYVWGATNLQQPGKYIADHVWSSTAMDTQLGCAAILKRLCDLDTDVKRRIESGATPVILPTPQVPAKKIDVAKTGTAGGIIVAGGLAAQQAAANGIRPAFIIAIVVATIAIAAMAFLFFHNRNKAGK